MELFYLYIGLGFFFYTMQHLFGTWGAVKEKFGDKYDHFYLYLGFLSVLIVSTLIWPYMIINNK